MAIQLGLISIYACCGRNAQYIVYIPWGKTYLEEGDHSSGGIVSGAHDANVNGFATTKKNTFFLKCLKLNKNIYLWVVLRQIIDSLFMNLIYYRKCLFWLFIIGMIVLSLVVSLPTTTSGQVEVIIEKIYRSKRVCIKIRELPSVRRTQPITIGQNFNNNEC